MIDPFKNIIMYLLDMLFYKMCLTVGYFCLYTHFSSLSCGSLCKYIFLYTF